MLGGRWGVRRGLVKLGFGSHGGRIEEMTMGVEIGGGGREMSGQREIGAWGGVRGKRGRMMATIS